MNYDSDLEIVSREITRIIGSRSKLTGFSISCNQHSPIEVMVVFHLSSPKADKDCQFGIRVSRHIIDPLPMSLEDAVKETLRRAGPSALFWQMKMSPGQIYISPDVQQEMEQSQKDFEKRIGKVAEELHYRMQTQRTRWEIEAAVDSLTSGSRDLFKLMLDRPYVEVGSGMQEAQANELMKATIVDLRDGYFINAAVCMMPNERTSYALEYLRTQQLT